MVMNHIAYMSVCVQMYICIHVQTVHVLYMKRDENVSASATSVHPNSTCLRHSACADVHACCSPAEALRGKMLRSFRRACQLWSKLWLRGCLHEVLKQRREIDKDAVIVLQGGKEASVYDTEAWREVHYDLCAEC